MPAQQPPREPSMEEILASIRRIIAEDGPNPEVGRPAATPATAPAPAPATEGSTEVLDLTEMVEETAASVDEPLELTELEEADPAPAEALSDDPLPVAPPSAAAAPEPEQPAPQPVATPEVVRRAAPPPPPAPPPSPTPKESPAAMVVPPAAEPPPAARPAADLVAPRAQDQTSVALGELVRTVRQEKQRAQPSQRSPLEALVLEALRPSLKAWMEQNLAPLVERVVREEVRRLTRRVEDQ